MRGLPRHADAPLSHDLLRAVGDDERDRPSLSVYLASPENATGAAPNYDRKVRAFDRSTGKLLWETTLPFSANATPAVYEAAGRQFVVICAEGSKGRRDDPKGAQYIAFALPANQ